MDRWLAHTLGWTLLLIGGGAIYSVMEGSTTTGLVVAIGVFAVSMGVTLVHEDIRRHQGDGRGNSVR